MVLFLTVWAFGTRAEVSGRAMLQVHPSYGWQKLRISSLLWLGCWDIGGDTMSGSSASCLWSNPELVFPSWMLSLMAGKMEVTVSWQGALSVHESRYTWIYSLSLFSFLLSLLSSCLLYNLFSAPACFLTLVFVWASAAVIISRQGLARTNAYACRHKNPQPIGPHDDCLSFMLWSCSRVCRLQF